jgi:hypothetical protein
VREAVSAKAFAWIANSIPTVPITKAMCVAKIVERISTAFTSGKVMVYRALQIRMFGKGETTDPTSRINSFEYFLFAGDRHSTLRS